MNFTKDLFNEPILDSLVLLAYPGGIADLHNDFECVNFTFGKEIFNIFFLGNDKRIAEIIMYDYRVQNAKITFDFTEHLILDNLYRGRILVNNTLLDADNDGRHCFYFHFIEDVYLEISAKRIVINFDKIIV